MIRSALGLECSLLLACARSCVDDAASPDVRACLGKDPDWDLLARLAHDHNLLPLVALELGGPRFADLLPDRARDSLKRVTYSATRRHFEYRERLRAMLNKLSAHRIPTILMKGASLAELVYPEPLMRLSADIDLMVRPCDLVRAARAILPSGYRLEHHLPARIDELAEADLSQLDDGHHPVNSPAYSRRHDYHLCFAHEREGDAPLIELHWKPAPARSLVLPLDELWDRAIPVQLDESATLILSPEHQIELILFHALNHGWAEGSLRSLLDLALTAARWPNLDWGHVVRTAKGQSARGHAYHVLGWARDYLGAPIPQEAVSALEPTDYERWSSRPMRTFAEMISLERRSCPRAKLEDIATGLRETRTLAGRSRFLAGVLAPPPSGLAQMRGAPQGWRLYLSYPLRPVLALCGAFRGEKPERPRRLHARS